MWGGERGAEGDARAADDEYCCVLGFVIKSGAFG